MDLDPTRFKRITKKKAWVLVVKSMDEPMKYLLFYKLISIDKAG